MSSNPEFCCCGRGVRASVESVRVLGWADSCLTLPLYYEYLSDLVVCCFHVVIIVDYLLVVGVSDDVGRSWLVGVFLLLFHVTYGVVFGCF